MCSTGVKETRVCVMCSSGERRPVLKETMCSSGVKETRACVLVETMEGIC